MTVRMPLSQEALTSSSMLSSSANSAGSATAWTPPPTFAKIDVNGEAAEPPYTWLKAQKGALVGRDIRWNFTKFLVNRKGEVVARFAPAITPEKIEAHVAELL